MNAMNSKMRSTMNTSRRKHYQISVRFSEFEYNMILKEAEENNMNSAEVLRRSRKAYIDNNDIEVRLLQLEARLTKKIFEIVSAIANIDEQEKIVATKKYHQSLKAVRQYEK